MQKSSKKKLFIFLGVLVVIAVFVVINLNKKGEKIKVQTEKVTKGKITETVSGSAKIQPEVQVKISAKVSGQIMELAVKEGDLVKKGQFLCQLDQEGYQASVEQNQSNLAFAQAGFSKSKSEYDRYKSLFSDNLASESELELAKSSYEQAKATVEQADAYLRQARDNLAKTTIKAPMDGIVSQLNKKLGEMAMGSQFTLDVIMVVADLAKMQAETEIDENDVIHVTLGDTSKISIDAFPDTTFNGVVTEIAHTGSTLGMGTQEEVTNFLVKVAMIEKPERLRPGMSSTVDIVTESLTDIIKVPIQCVTIRKPIEEESSDENRDKKEEKSDDTDNESLADSTAEEDKEEEGADEEEQKPAKVVFVVKDGVVKQVEVETGISSDTEWEIKSGLEEDTEIVSGPYRVLSKQLKDGDEVEVEKKGKKPSGDSESD